MSDKEEKMLRGIWEKAKSFISQLRQWLQKRFGKKYIVSEKIPFEKKEDR